MLDEKADRGGSALLDQAAPFDPGPEFLPPEPKPPAASTEAIEADGAFVPPEPERHRPRLRGLLRRPRTPRVPLSPSAKLAAGMAGVTAIGALAGISLGLPTPFESRGAPPADVASAVDSELLAQASATAALPVSHGTAAAATRGPYHPVIGPADYGEEDARFGASRGGRSHAGHDVFSKAGTPLVAVRDGVVVDGGSGSRMQSGAGHYVSIYSRMDDRTYVYLHMLKAPLVRKGQRVRAGQMIGRMGCTGSCFGVHLHFEVRRGRHRFLDEKKAIDPLPLLKSWPKAPRP